MSRRICIVSVPEGAGHISLRTPYVGCTFTLADEEAVRAAQQRFAESGAAVPPPSGYAVKFEDVLAGLRANTQSDWANYLLSCGVRPKLMHFPTSCARIIK